MVVAYRFTRECTNGNLVKVEIWKDERTNKPVRITRLTYIKNAGFITNRAEVYIGINKAEFETWLEEEKNYLNDCREALGWIEESENEKVPDQNDKATIMERQLEKIDIDTVTEGLSGLAATAAIMRVTKGEQATQPIVGTNVQDDEQQSADEEPEQ